MKTYLFTAVAAFVVGGTAFAQGPPNKPSPATPVVVVNPPSNPVPVNGSVDVSNDVVNTPYLESRSAAFNAQGLNEGLSFDVPDGMRLIVETIAVRVTLNGPGFAAMQFVNRKGAGVPQAGGALALLSQGAIEDAFGPLTWLVGSHAIKLRIDAVPETEDELIFFPRLSPVSGTLNVLVAGYLVPIP